MLTHKEKQYIMDKISELQKVLLLHHYTVSVEFHSSLSGPTANCSFVHPYTDATIRFDVSEMKKIFDADDMDTVDHICMHELCHLITDEFYSIARNRFVTDGEIEREREHLTDRVAMIVTKLKRDEKKKTSKIKKRNTSSKGKGRSR